MNIQTDVIAALPEIFVLSMAMFILLIDLFIKPANRIVVFMLAQATLLGAAYITMTTHVASVTYSFSGMFVDDPMADVLKLMIYLSTALMLIYTRTYITLRGMFRGEFYALVLFAVAGMMIMVSGQHFLTLYMGLELLSLCLYALVAMDRDKARAAEAAMRDVGLGG